MTGRDLITSGRQIHIKKSLILSIITTTVLLSLKLSSSPIKTGESTLNSMPTTHSILVQKQNKMYPQSPVTAVSSPFFFFFFQKKINGLVFTERRTRIP